MRIKESLVLRHIGEEYMIVDPGKGVIDLANVYTLNQTAAWLWKRLEGEIFTLKDVVSLLVENYEVQFEEARRDADKWVMILKEQGLIVE